MKVYDGYRRAKDDLAEAQLMLEDSDPDVREMAEEEIGAAESHMSSAEAELQVLMLPKDPKDKSNVFLEIRAGTGGDEQPFFPVTCFACTADMQRVSVGRLKLSQNAPANTVATRN